MHINGEEDFRSHDLAYSKHTKTMSTETKQLDACFMLVLCLKQKQIMGSDTQLPIRCVDL
jgi:hypothetical protein